MQVSVLYREPKLLKGHLLRENTRNNTPVSVLYREPKLLKGQPLYSYPCAVITLVGRCKHLWSLPIRSLYLSWPVVQGFVWGCVRNSRFVQNLVRVAKCIDLSLMRYLLIGRRATEYQYAVDDGFRYSVANRLRI